MLNDDKRAEEIKALARDYAEDAIETLVEVMRDGDAKAVARVSAARTLLERGFGAPERKVEQQVDVRVYDERQAHLSALQRLAARANPVMEDKRLIQDAEYTEIKNVK
jgi:peptidyl-tRNA hydrolase